MKTPEEIAAEEEQASKEQREQLAREANKKRNDAMLEARNAIADRADENKVDEDELEPLTDEVWDQEDGTAGKPKKKTRAELIEEQDSAEERERNALSEEEKERRAAAKIIADAQAEDEDLDEARDAGADDVRRTDAGVTEYKVGGKWLTLSQLRALGGEVLSEEDTGQGAGDGATTRPARGPTPEQLEEQRQAAEADRRAKREAFKAKLKDLHLRASMGDEEAIDQLADIQADSPRVTPEDIERMVNRQVDARVEGKTAFDRAVEWFESDQGYGRELKAPGFKKRAAVIDAELAKEHPDWAPRKRLDETGKKLRAELNEFEKYLGVKPRAGNGNDRDTDQNSRLDRKRRAAGAEAPRASGRAREDQEPDEKESTADAIASLARSRGQARPIQH